MQPMQDAAALLRDARGHAQDILERLPGMRHTPTKAERLLSAAHPWLQRLEQRGQELRRLLSPYYSDDWKEAALSLVLLFCGNQLAMTLACWEAFQVAGSRHISRSWQELRQSFEEAKSTMDKDKEVTTAFGAVALRRSPGEMLLEGLREVAAAKTDEERCLARRKVFIVIRCIDPSKILDASLGFWTGVVAVLATLRQRFVYCVNVGAQVGHQVADSIMPSVQQRLHQLYPEHRQWVDFGLRAAVSGSSVVASWLLLQFVTTFNAAFKGATRLSALMDKRRREGKDQWLGQWIETEEQMRMAVWALTLAGLSAQVRRLPSVPGAGTAGLLFKLPIAPVFLVEYLLRCITPVALTV
jgi:hypothetical protein